MPKIVTQQQIELAIELRKQGKTYEEISKLAKVGKTWCKQHLAGVESNDTLLTDELCAKSRTSKALSKGDISKALNLYDLPETEAVKKLNSKVRQIRSKDKQNIVRPDWMVPEVAGYVTKEIVQFSMVLEERCDEAAYELWSILSSIVQDKSEVPSVRKIKSAMIGLASAMCTGSNGGTQKLSNWLDSLYTTANKLVERNQQKSLQGYIDSSAKLEVRPLDEDLEAYVF